MKGIDVILIWTTNFAHAKDLPDTVAKFSIARKPILGWANNPEHSYYEKLMPTYDILKNFKEKGDEEEYTKQYYSKVLNRLDASMVVFQLEQMAMYRNCKDVALICYERPEKFCHRHLVADWLNANGFTCKEYDYEKENLK